MTPIEQAIFQNIQFPSTQGPLSLQDVASLPLTSDRGNNISKMVRAAATKVTPESSSLTAFLDDVDPATNPTDQLRFDVLKRIFEIKKEQKASSINEQQFKKQLDDIEAQIADRKANEMKELPLAELEARRAALLASKA